LTSENRTRSLRFSMSYSMPRAIRERSIAIIRWPPGEPPPWCRSLHGRP
jgi:hypothetical protein